MATKLAWGIPAIALLSACTGLTERIEGNVDQAGKSVSSLVQETGRTAPGVVVKPPAAVAHEPGIWLGKNIVKLSPAVLPSVFYEDATFDRTVTSLAEVAERITLRSGIPTKVSPDAQAFLDADDENQGNGQAGDAPTTASATHRAPPVRRQPQPDGGRDRTDNDAPQPIRIAYANGDFKGLLDTAAARFGVSWKYDNGTIHFYHTDSRTFQINSLPGASTYSATVASGATSTGGVGGGSGGGGASSETGGVTANNSQNTGVTTRMSVYESIENTVRAMLSPYGRVVASPATGTMTVVDTPDALERVADYIEKENAALSRQVVINVTVLSVNLEDSDEYGIDWNLVYSDLRRTFGVNTQLPLPSQTNSFSVGIIGNSRFAGSTALINALSKQGKVRRQTTASVVTLNNQPVPVQVARQTSYLQSMETSVVAQVGTTTTLTPGTVTSGFNMSILPHVLTNGTVLLQFSTDISSLREIREVESGTSRIEVPELDTRNFLQRVAMKSGETLIISGFEQTDENLDRRGTGAPNNYLFGGGFTAGRNKESIVILITPATLGA